MDFSWVPIYLKRQKNKAKIREIQAKLKDIRALDPANEDVHKAAISDVPTLRHEIIKQIAIYLDNKRRAANPFSSRIDRLIEFLPALYIDEDMVNEAVPLMPIRDNCEPIDEKRKKISSQEKLLKKETSELEKNSPPEHFLWQNGVPTMDLCEALERKWRSVQGKFNAPCGPLGHELSSEPEPVQQAWRLLEIRSAMSPTSKNAPIPRRA
jgi:hypothetical protein